LKGLVRTVQQVKRVNSNFNPFLVPAARDFIQELRSFLPHPQILNFNSWIGFDRTLLEKQDQPGSRWVEAMRSIQDAWTKASFYMELNVGGNYTHCAKGPQFSYIHHVTDSDSYYQLYRTLSEGISIRTQSELRSSGLWGLEAPSRDPSSDNERRMLAKIIPNDTSSPIRVLLPPHIHCRR